MEAQMRRPVDQHLEQEQDVGLHSGESNQPGEKKSILKKVKDKARKLKGTMKKQGQGQGQGQEHEYRYDENLEEEDEDDEEIANDREIHGEREDRIDTMVKGEAKARPNIPIQMGDEQKMQPVNKHFSSPMNPISLQGEEAKDEEPAVKLGPSMGLEEDPHSTKIRPGEAPVPPSNYESKVPDPTGDGGKEAEVAPLIRRLDNQNGGDESETKPESEQSTFTGSHDQFSPQPTPTQDHYNKLDAAESDPKSFDSNKSEGMPPDTMTGKVSSATSAITDKAISAKNTVVSKLGYGESGQEGMSNKPESESAPGYTQKIAETLNPVYEKVAGAGTAVRSKFQGGGEAENEGELRPKEQT